MIYTWILYASAHHVFFLPTFIKDSYVTRMKIHVTEQSLACFTSKFKERHVPKNYYRRRVLFEGKKMPLCFEKKKSFSLAFEFFITF